MKDVIEKKLKSLERERKSKISKINSEYEREVKSITSGFKKDDVDGDYELRFDLRKNVVVSDKYGFTHDGKPCNKWSRKSDWFVVEIEDYDVFTTFTDCGYGECDEHAMFRVIQRYEVCPNCGRMVRLSTKRLEHGKSKTRWGDEDGFDIRPFGWKPRVRVIGREKRK